MILNESPGTWFTPSWRCSRAGNAAGPDIEPPEQGSVVDDIPEPVVDFLERDVFPPRAFRSEKMGGPSTRRCHPGRCDGTPAPPDTRARVGAPDRAEARAPSARRASRRPGPRAGVPRCSGRESASKRALLGLPGRRRRAVWSRVSGPDASARAFHCAAGAPARCVGARCPAASTTRSRPRAREAAGRERIPVIGPNGLRQPDLPKHGFEARAGVSALAHRRQALAHQEHPTAVIRDGQRKAVAAIARLELPFEIHGPHLVRATRRAAARYRDGPTACGEDAGATAPRAPAGH